MSRNSHLVAPARPGIGAIVLGTLDLPPSNWFPWHEHLQHQLIWTPRSVVLVNIADKHWVLPPSRALWVPAGTVHRTGATSHIALQGIYLDPARCPVDWPEPVMLAVSPLLRELLTYLADPALGAHRRAHAESVVFDLLEPVRTIPVGVRWPVDSRARDVATLLERNPADPRPLAELASSVGAGTRTMARLFARETGLSFGRWRTQLRLRAALPLLAKGDPLAGVARRVGYGTSSAFVAAFHREVGISPGRYFGGTPQPDRDTEADQHHSGQVE